MSRTRKKWNLYIASELNKWPCNPTNNFLLKTCLFDTDKLVRNPIKSQLIYHGSGATFDGECYWSCDNGFTVNVGSLGVDNTQSCDTDHEKNKFLVLGEGPIDGINDSTGAQKKNSVSFSNIQNFAKVSIAMVMRVTCK